MIVSKARAHDDDGDDDEREIFLNDGDVDDREGSEQGVHGRIHGDRPPHVCRHREKKHARHLLHKAKAIFYDELFCLPSEPGHGHRTSGWC